MPQALDAYSTESFTMSTMTALQLLQCLNRENSFLFVAANSESWYARIFSGNPAMVTQFLIYPITALKFSIARVFALHLHTNVDDKILIKTCISYVNA